ncbi:transketolase [Anaerococcus hydrogenalis DSM 7454]|uniref:Transketolase n=1 Tax=Anaerococcus hydrogenalis DSM 7454 TaxID=561177 RepID=B6WB22_9FIRM|nr:transketolase [Anaerococcus hydrogenalis]EEB35291.1 transketolase [Anaerococcus hydrogenalis DSM 7454]
MFNNEDQKAVDALRVLSISQIEKANSGHPGLPMGAAPMAYVLWNKVLNTNPKNSKWINRDRFVLSAGHGSALLYSLLHLSGFNLSLDDLKEFRQVGSKTPGHPERMHTDGVEVTTGPLGQGVANAVGLAMAEKHLSKLYNKDDYKLMDHYTYALCGDGDLMEGVAHEAISLAGHLKLSKLILLYDSNDICLDGDLSTSFTENVEETFKACNWSYIKVEDGNNLEEILKAIEQAKSDNDKPTLIEVKTTIGYGSENEGTNKVHGSPIGADDFKKAKERYNWVDDDFVISDEIYKTFEQIQKRGKEENQKWDQMYDSYKKNYPDLAQELEDGFNRKLPKNWIDKVKKYSPEDKAIATRASSHEILQDIAREIPNLWGGSADLFSSNKTDIKDTVAFRDESPEGRNVWYGVREFAMATIANGILAHGGSFHHVSTFLVFSDYLKSAVRVSALSKLPTTYVFTHDSIAVGEDGPTHQPIEQLAMLRSIPDTIVLRPADANEVRLSWKIALESKEKPVVIALTRQNVSNLEQTTKLDNIDKGAYIISDSDKKPEGILIATGSEVELALETKEILKKQGKDIRVISMPSMELFRDSGEDYIEELLPMECKNIVSIEMGTSFGWGEFTGRNGLNISIDRFGISGEGSQVQEELGFTAEKIAEAYNKKFDK